MSAASRSEERTADHHVFNVRVPWDLWWRLQARASVTGRSAHSVALRALRAYLEDEEDGE